MDSALTHIQQSLDEIMKVEKDLQYWSARDLMSVLGYTTWRKFEEAIHRAMESCKTSGQTVSNHFVSSDKMVVTRSIVDVSYPLYYLLCL